MNFHDLLILMIRQRRWRLMRLRMGGKGIGKAFEPVMDGFKAAAGIRGDQGQ